MVEFLTSPIPVWFPTLIVLGLIILLIAMVCTVNYSDGKGDEPPHP